MKIAPQWSNRRRLSESRDVRSVRTVLRAFTPRRFGSNLVAWYDASQETFADGDSVGTFTDRSGNGNDLSQATGSDQPTFKTDVLHHLDFDGTNDWMETADFASAITQPNTIVIVGRQKQSNAGFFVDGNDDTDRNAVFTSAGEWRIFSGSTKGSASPAQNTDWHLFVAQFDGASSFLRLDGVEIVQSNAGTRQLDGLRVGAPGDDSTSNALIDIAELFVLDQGITTNEVALIEAGLNDKYAIF